MPIRTFGSGILFVSGTAHAKEVSGFATKYVPETAKAWYDGMHVWLVQLQSRAMASSAHIVESGRPPKPPSLGCIKIPVQICTCGQIRGAQRGYDVCAVGEEIYFIR